VKTFDPPLSALAGATVTGTSRHGKFLDLDVDGLHLVVHLARAGWLQWRESLPAAPPRPGKGSLAFRLHLDDGAGFALTEAGTQKRLAVYLVRDAMAVPGIARLGPDALAVDAAELAAILAGQRAQIKGALTDQAVIAGIGNAYSDEILHTAQLSPFKIAAKLTLAEVSGFPSRSRRCSPTRSPGRWARRRQRSRAKSAPSSKRTPAPAYPARCAATRSVRCPSRTSRSSTARRVRPKGVSWPTAASQSSSSSQPYPGAYPAH